MFTEIHCIVSGRVQRVGYRDCIERYAKEQELFGWIKNHENGTVEIVLQGMPDALKACTDVLHQGSPLSQIESVLVEWRSPENLYTEFRVIAS